MSEPQSYGTKMKSRAGFARIGNALAYALAGLRAAYAKEHAFRQEVWVIAPLVVVAFLVPEFSSLARVLQVGSLMLILIVELINSAIESNTDHITLEQHPLARHAKDLGSAAVFLAILNAVFIWGTILWDIYGRTVLGWFS